MAKKRKLLFGIIMKNIELQNKGITRGYVIYPSDKKKREQEGSGGAFIKFVDGRKMVHSFAKDFVRKIHTFPWKYFMLVDLATGDVLYETRSGICRYTTQENVAIPRDILDYHTQLRLKPEDLKVDKIINLESIQIAR